MEGGWVGWMEGKEGWMGGGVVGWRGLDGGGGGWMEGG